MDVRRVHIPVPGLYRLRLAKGSPWVAVRIWDSAERCPDTGELLEDENFHCLVGGRDVNPEWYAERVNCFGETINEAEYNYLLGLGQWAADHDPDSPEAKPRERVDINTTKPVF